MARRDWLIALVTIALLAVTLACSQAPEPEPAPPTSNAASSQAPQPQPQAGMPEGNAPPATAAPAGAEPTAPPPATAKEPAPPKSPANAAPAPAVQTASKHEAVGSAKCKMCHKVQYESWAASKHATVEPKAECETCHGNGKDYISMSVMKNRAQALAAGLLLPGKEFCTAKCHKPAAFKAEMLQAVHAHKAK